MSPEKREELRDYARTKLRKISGILDACDWKEPNPEVSMVMGMTDAKLIHYVKVQKMMDKGYKRP